MTGVQTCALPICVPVLVHNYVASSGNVYPENIDYSYRDPNGHDYLYIHNNHPQGGIQPHTYFPSANRAQMVQFI